MLNATKLAASYRSRHLSHYVTAFCKWNAVPFNFNDELVGLDSVLLYGVIYRPSTSPVAPVGSRLIVASVVTGA